MALLHLTTSKSGLRLEGDVPLDAAEGVIAALEAVPPGTPVVILIHGYMYDPSPRGRAAGRDPHSLLFGMRGASGRKHGADWPGRLGFHSREANGGLCIGFGWPAHVAHLSVFARRGRNSLAETYRRAGAAGEALAELISAFHSVRPDLRFDLFAHSLGARVALRAMGARGVGRLLLLGAAEYTAVAKERARAARGASVYNFIARQNDPFDLAFELLTKSPAAVCAGALGRAGVDGLGNWIDLQLDNPGLERWLAQRGLPLGPSRAPVCHWSFYTRQGSMEIYRSLIRNRADWSIAALRASGAPEEIHPRWSRFFRRPVNRGGQGAPTPA